MLSEIGGREQFRPAMQVLGALAVVVDIFENSSVWRGFYMEVYPFELRSKLKIRAKRSEDLGRIAEAVGKKASISGGASGRIAVGDYIMADVADD